jgi:hypothetical protein
MSIQKQISNIQIFSAWFFHFLTLPFYLLFNIIGIFLWVCFLLGLIGFTQKALKNRRIIS